MIDSQKISNTLITVLILLFQFYSPLHAQKAVVTVDMNWANFLNQHDSVWEEIKSDYNADIIMENGLLGNSICKEKNAHKFQIGKVDVTKGRIPVGKSQYNNLYYDTRLSIGHFLLSPIGESLNLWDAATTATLLTNQGETSMKSYIHATNNLIVIETKLAATVKQKTSVQKQYGIKKTIV